MARFEHLCGRDPKELAAGSTVAIVKIRDEVNRIPAFLAYHRWIGVDHFVFIDNGSIDGSVEHLEREPAVTVVRTSESLSFQHEWIRHWFEQLPLTSWALVLDMDEHFVCLPWQRNGLRTTQRILDAAGAQIAIACMVDFYPYEFPFDRTQQQALPWQRCPYFDRGPYLKWDHGSVVTSGKTKLLLGGVRERLSRPLPLVRTILRRMPKFMRGRHWFGATPQLRKMPLIKRDKSVVYDNCHSSRAARYADTLFPLLHFKLDHDFTPKVNASVARRNYDRLSAGPECLKDALSRPRTLYHPKQSRKLEGLSSLIEARLCLIGPSFAEALSQRDTDASIAKIGHEVTEELALAV